MTIFDVAFLGTSLTAGTGTGWVNETRVNGGLWQSLLARALRPGKSEEFLYYNLGISGGTSFDPLPFVSAWAALRPRMVIMEFCMNDAATARNVSLAESRSNVESIINTFRLANPDVLVGLMTTNKVLGSRVPLRPNLSEYYQQYRDIVAERSDLFLVDNEPAWADATEEQIPDGIHPLLEASRSRLIPALVAAISPHMI